VSRSGAFRGVSGASGAFRGGPRRQPREHRAGGAGDEVVSADVVVVGAGAAGLTAALGCAPLQVVVLTKARLAAGGAGGASLWAQGGVASAVGEDDDPALHAADTLAAGAGLNDARIVRLLTGEGPRRIRALLELGARFDRDARGRLALGREAAHSRRRILHASGDATGAEVVRALVEAVRREPAIRVVDQAFALDLALAGGAVAGVSALHRAGRRVLYRAPAVVLATGGLGQLFLYTTNPREATADGLAMAARAGARLVDLEFVQFHPTALAAGLGADAVRAGVDGGERAGVRAEGRAGGGWVEPLALLTEALRGEGAVLVDDAGVRFMTGVHPGGELAPRDVVARAIWARLREGRRVFLDARRAVGERFPERFPTVFALCRRHGLDPRVEPLPVVPAAHYHMGGVAVDASGRTSLPGLWACGEVAATGAHGANRLASNSLLEALVFGARVAEDVAAGGFTARRAAGAPERVWGGVGAEVEGVAAVGAAAAAAKGTAAAAPAGAALVGDAALEGGAPVDAAGPEAPVEEAATLVAALRRLMWERVGVERDEAGLAAAAAELEELAWRHPKISGLHPAGIEAAGPAAGWLAGEARNLLWAGCLLAQAALARRESRGGHYRTDHPSPDAAWQRRLFLTAAADGAACFESPPAPGAGRRATAMKGAATAASALAMASEAAVTVRAVTVAAGAPYATAAAFPVGASAAQEKALPPGEPREPARVAAERRA
jgi:L-aspartate oxidase